MEIELRARHGRKLDKNIPKAALDWKPQNRRRRSRPAQTWRRSRLAELQDIVGVTGGCLENSAEPY